MNNRSKREIFSKIRSLDERLQELDRLEAVSEGYTDYLRQSEQRYRLLFEDSPISLWVEDVTEASAYLERLNLRGEELRRYLDDNPKEVSRLSRMIRAVDVNQSTVRLYEADNKQELLGSLDQIFTKESLDSFKEQLIAFSEGKSVYEGETVNRTLRGKRKNIVIKWSMSEQARVDLSRVYVSVLDISERKRIEKELIQAKEDAESITRKLQEALEKMKQLALEAESASIAKSQFLANISHEMRTPMNSIIGFTEMLLEEELLADQRESVEMIMASAHTLLNLINDTLDLSKIEAGKIDLEESVFNLESIIIDCVELVRGRIREKPVEILCDLEEGLPLELVGDSMRIQQVLLNLLSNAEKFTEEGEIVITVHSEQCGDDRNRIVFSVRDTGVGIPPDKHERIFEAFSQGDESTTRKYGGTGLGLTICQRLIRLMGGEIRVESRVGEGSTFTFDVRVRAVGGRDHTGERSALKRNLGGCGVLILDDNVSSRKILEKIARRAGMRTVTCETAREALDRLKKEKVDLVLADIRLPEIDGFMFARKAADLLGKDRPRMIALSFYPHKELIARVRDAGFDAFLSKPFRPGTLLVRMARFFGYEKPRRERQPRRDTRTARNCRLKILVAEDNEVNQQLMIRMIRKMGHDLEIVSDGEEVLEKVSGGGFDLVFMDVRMPRLDGLETTRKLREAGFGIPVIAMTAHAMIEDRQKAMKSGMDDYVSKPVTRNAIRSVINRYCPEQVPPEAGRTSRILVVDDDPNHLHFLKDVFNTEFPDAALKTVDDGVKACTMLGSFLPHLVIMDLAMPNMDGVSVIELILSDKRFSEIQVIVITGLHPGAHQVEQVKQMGITRIFHKPYALEGFLEAVRSGVSRGLNF